MCIYFWFCATEHKTRTKTSITRKPHNKFLQAENSQYIPIQIHYVHSWMLWDQMTELFIWCYTQIKNPQHPYEEDRDNWPKVDRQKRSGSEVIGGVDLRLIGGLGRLVGQWRRALVAATLRMSQAGSGESEIERWEFERVGLREIREMRASDESDWERQVWE